MLRGQLTQFLNLWGYQQLVPTGIIQMSSWQRGSRYWVSHLYFELRVTVQTSNSRLQETLCTQAVVKQYFASLKKKVYIKKL